MLLKEYDMEMLKREQFEHENKTWERSLDFFRQENAFLKNRLSAVVDSKEDKEFLNLAEYYQNQFLLKDEFIRDLKADVNEQKKLLKEDLNNDATFLKISKKQDKLRNEMNTFEKDFSGLRYEFNKSISQYLS